MATRQRGVVLLGGSGDEFYVCACEGSCGATDGSDEKERNGEPHLFFELLPKWNGFAWRFNVSKRLKLILQHTVGDKIKRERRRNKPIKLLFRNPFLAHQTLTNGRKPRLSVSEPTVATR